MNIEFEVNSPYVKMRPESYFLELKKYCNVPLIIDYQIEEITYEFFNTEIKTNKWVDFTVWLKIQEKVEQMMKQNLENFESEEIFLSHSSVCLLIVKHPSDIKFASIFQFKQSEMQPFMIRIDIKQNKTTVKNDKVLSRNVLQNNGNGSLPVVSLESSSNNTKNNNIYNKPKSSGQYFPKPGYSYSCLIAMALKNSRSGSLLVTEIYSFLCEHFPYFKTAPNVWKNTVRNTLSLNKCVEIPATNGGQRKGCLWAMNPIKITEMDEEVQKSSRKDPMAIRKAMVHPEHLEALERGEMKHGSTGDSVTL